MTPSHGTPTIGDQASYDADQDARIRRLRAAQFRGAATAIDRASSQRWRLVGALLVHEQVP